MQDKCMNSAADDERVRLNVLPTVAQAQFRATSAAVQADSGGIFSHLPSVFKGKDNRFEK